MEEGAEKYGRQRGGGTIYPIFIIQAKINKMYLFIRVKSWKIFEAKFNDRFFFVMKVRSPSWQTANPILIV